MQKTRAACSKTARLLNASIFCAFPGRFLNIKWLANRWSLPLSASMIFLADVVDVWAIVGKVSVVVAVIGGILGILGKFREPKERLECTVLFAPFRLPFALRDMADHLCGEAKKKLAEGEYLNSYSLLDGWDAGKASKLDSVESVIFARIDNAGTKKCSGVALSLPGSHALVKIARGKDEQIVVKPNDSLTIGEMAPKESVYIVTWTTRHLSEPNYYDIHLSHDMGLGKVRWQYQTKNRVAAAFGNDPMYALFLAFASIAIAYCGMRAITERVAKPSTTAATPVPATPAPTPAPTSPVLKSP